MTPDDRVFFAMLASGGRYEHSVRPAVAATDSVTAAIISKPKLLVMTLDAAGTPQAAFNARKSRVFELEDRSSGALRALNAALCGFFSSAKIERVFLRVSSDCGTHAAHPWHFKIEAALQLANRLEVTFMNTHSVRAWVYREAPQLPAFEPLEPGARWRIPQEKCLETALFVAANADQPRFFLDGTHRDG